MPDDHNNQSETVLNLLAEATSLDVVREFLRKKGLLHSGTRQEVRENMLAKQLIVW